MNQFKKLTFLLTTAALAGAIVIPSAICSAPGNVMEVSAVQTIQKTSVKLNNSSMSLGMGEEYQLSGTVTGLTDTALQWSSSSNRIVTVKNGKIKGVAIGTAVITAKAKNGTKATCTVTVKKAPEKIDLPNHVLSLGVGERFSLSSILDSNAASASRTYRSSNSSIVKMTKTNWTGEFVAQKPGVAYVTVRTYNGKECSCRINVRNAPKMVTLTRGLLTMGVGEKFTLSAGIDDGAAAASRIYRSSDNSIVKMTKTNWTGEFIAKRPGVAYVTVRLYNGLEKSCKVIVKRAPTRLDFEKTVAVMDPGSTFRIRPVFSSSEGALRITYSVKDPSVASVDAYGNVKAKKSGTTEIRVTAYNNIYADFEVIVSGVKDKTTFPVLNETDKLLNSAKLYPVKTQYEPVDTMIDTLFAKILKGNMTQAQKVRACYDYLAQNCSYRFGEHPDMSSRLYEFNEDREAVWLSYSILKDKIGVCDNFSAAFVVMLRRLGFEANLAHGQVGMTSGGYGAHTWVDVVLGGKHYIFDPQVENNNIRSDGSVGHFFYGMKAEHNSKLYRYEDVSRIHNFNCLSLDSAMGFQPRLTVTAGSQKLECSEKLPQGEFYQYVYFSDHYPDWEQATLKMKQADLKPVNFTVNMLTGPSPYYVELYVAHSVGSTLKPVYKEVVVNKSYDKKNTFSWTPSSGKGEYNVKVAIYSASHASFVYGDDMINAFDYCIKYNFHITVE